MQDLYIAGGVQAVMKELSDNGYLNTELITATGEKVSTNISGANIKDPNVIRSIDKPYSKTGGIAILKGNLAPDGAVVKAAAVAPEMLNVITSYSIHYTKLYEISR